MENRRLKHEFWILYPRMINESPKLLLVPAMILMKKFIEKHGGEENALKELMRLNETENDIVEFCELCGKVVSERDIFMSQKVRNKKLCIKHTVNMAIEYS